MYSKNMLCVKKYLQLCNRKYYLKFNSFCSAATVVPAKLTHQYGKLNSSLEICKQNDFTNALNILNNTYNNDEPLMKALNINKSLQSYDVLIKYWMNGLKDGSSYKAINLTDNSIIAVMVNCLHSTWSADHFYELKNQCQCVELQQLFAIWAMLGQTSDLRNKYENCKVFELSTLAVINAFQLHGLGQKLLQISLQYGKEKGYDVAKVDCTNSISTKMARKLNMELVWEMSYKEIFDTVGISKNKLPKSPHISVQSFAIKLN